MSIDLKKCRQECSDCVVTYAGKHRLNKPGFKIPCQGIPQKYLQNNILMSVGGDPEVAVAMVDPVTWANKFIDWHCIDPDGSIWKRKSDKGTLGELPAYNEFQAAAGKSIFHRPYQAQMLRCSSKRKVFRLGRQCLAADSFIQLWDGTVKSIKDIKPGDQLLSLNEEDSRIEMDKVVDSWSSGKKPVFKLRTKFGHEITCTDTHPFYSITKVLDYKNGYTIHTVPKEWKTIADGLEVGHKIAIPVFEKVSFSKVLDEGIPELIGYFLADGSSAPKQSAKFTNINEQYLVEFTSLCSKLGTKVNPYPKGNGFDLIITNGRRKPNPVRDLLKEYQLVNITGPQKRIPRQITTAPLDQIRLFINRFWAGDGYISTFQRTGRDTFRTEIGMLQENRFLLEDLQRLLWRFGVHGYIKPEGNNWRYVVSNKLSVVNFLTKIGPIYGKEIACEVAEKNIDSIGDKYCKWYRNVMWDHISSIEYIGEEETYDIEVEKNHNFIANGIYTHNSGKTECLCIAMLHGLWTHENFRIVVIAPFQSQIDLIFARLVQMIKSNIMLSNDIVRNVKAPNYTIELKNGSRVIGFTAGTRSGQDAGASRGQTAQMLVFDEADYLSVGDINASLAIITNFPDATVWMSSTPTGRRERFYDTCYSRLFREFHFPSQINPNWTQELDSLYKEQLTEDGYKHEILAEFGEQEEGVYQAKYVELAQSNYEYKNMSKQKGWDYVIGVDWNDVKIGVTIAVVGLNPSEGYFYIVDKKIISKSEYTQLKGCEAVAEYNRLWRPFAIYIDKGFGATQYEILRKYGHESIIKQGKNSPDAKLARIVKPYDFGGSIETYDLFSKQPIKKAAKAFLVENSVRRFEQCRVKYPKSDEMYTKALLGYIVKRMSQSGVPVYEQQNLTAGDHFLDAVNLALVAFFLEKTELGKPRFSNHISFSGSLGIKIDPESDNNRAGKRMGGGNMPQLGRAEAVDQFNRDNKIIADPRGLPGAHINSEMHVGLWDWPGFSRDEPKPQVRSLRQAFRQSEKKFGPRSRRPGPPRRNKF